MHTGRYINVEDNPNGLLALLQIAVSMILVLAVCVMASFASGWKYVQAELLARGHEKS
jgi:hypothetical protein